MNLNKFLKPTKWTIIFFIVLLILFSYLLALDNTKIFPCKVRPVLPDAIFKESVCGLAGFISFGAEQVFTFSGYLIAILMLIVIPYLISCIINSLIKRK